MKKQAVVNQIHLYTRAENLMFKGELDCTHTTTDISLSYQEADEGAKVTVISKEDMLSIHRESDVCTHLQFIPQQKSKGKILTEFGEIEIDLFTHRYIKENHKIVVKYDILQNDEVIEGYQIVWNIKEESE